MQQRRTSRLLCRRGSKPPVGSTYIILLGPWQCSRSKVTCACAAHTHMHTIFCMGIFFKGRRKHMQPMAGRVEHHLSTCSKNIWKHSVCCKTWQKDEGMPRRRAGRPAAGGRETSRRSGSQPAGGPLCRSHARPPAGGQILSALSWPSPELSCDLEPHSAGICVYSPTGPC